MPYKNYEDRKRWMKENWLRRMLTVAKARAKRNNIEFDITLEDVLVPTHCPITGIKLEAGHVGGKMKSYSLDRIDNAKGYIKGNVALISHRANSCKSDLSLEEARRLVAYMERAALKLE